MRVILTNIFTGRSADISGNPLSVEEQIREFFKGGFQHIPHGDLQALLTAVARVYGFSLSIPNSIDYIPPQRRIVRRPLATDDPWVREVDANPTPTS